MVCVTAPASLGSSFVSTKNEAISCVLGYSSRPEVDMAFIRTIPPSGAEGPVREMYERVQNQLGYVPNWAQAFSLRPAVMDGWVALLSSIRNNLTDGATSSRRSRPLERSAAPTAPWRTGVCSPTRCSIRRR